MGTEDFQQAVLYELKEHRKLLDRTVGELSDRVTVIERRTDKRSALISAITSIALAFITAFVGCACVVRRVEEPGVSSGPTPADIRKVDKAVVKIDEHTDYADYTGTGTFVSYNDWLVVLTAGHMCEDDATYELETFSGEHVKTWPIFQAHEDTNDVCVMSYADTYEPQEYLELAHAGPRRGDEVWYLGYPLGMPAVYSGHVIRPVFEGYTLVSIDGFHGASGSSILNADNDVVAVLVAGWDVYPATIETIPLATVEDDLATALEY